MTWRYEPPKDLSCQDVLEFLRGLPDGCIDLVLVDPPYGLRFMQGRGGWDDPSREGTWDDRAQGRRLRRAAPEYAEEMSEAKRYAERRGSSVQYYRQDIEDFRNYAAWCQAWATEALRILRPGGFLLAMSGARTYDALAWGVRMAGFEIRDALAWVTGQGMPKSMDVGKALDKAAGAAPGTPDAARWAGYGTATKPGMELIVCARAPFPGTLVENLKAYGTGALDIDSGRIPATGKPPGWLKTGTVGSKAAEGFQGTSAFRIKERTPEEVAHVGEAHARAGRWPPSYLVSHAPTCVRVGKGGKVDDWRCVDPLCPVQLLDSQTGVLKSGKMAAGSPRKKSKGVGFQGSRTFAANGPAAREDTIADAGGPSRFFTLPDPEAPTVEHLPGCKVVKVRKVPGDNRGEPGGRRPGGFKQPGAPKGDSKPNARVYSGREVPIYECAPGCPVQRPFLVDEDFELPNELDAARLAVGCYAGKVHPRDRELPGYWMIVPKSPYQKSDGPCVDEALAKELCERWAIPVRAGETALEVLMGWPLPLEAVEDWAGEMPASAIGKLAAKAAQDAARAMGLSVDLLVVGREPGGGQSEADRRWAMFKPAVHMHPTCKPLNLGAFLVRTFSPRPETVGRPVLVLDCFGGAASFPLAAMQEERTAVYNDFTPQYVAAASARFDAAGLRPLPASRLVAPEPRRWGGDAVAEPVEAVYDEPPAPPQALERTCPKCGTSGPVEELFGWRRMRKDGPVRPQAWCRPCRSGRPAMQETAP